MIMIQEHKGHMYWNAFSMCRFNKIQFIQILWMGWGVAEIQLF